MKYQIHIVIITHIDAGLFLLSGLEPVPGHCSYVGGLFREVVWLHRVFISKVKSRGIKLGSFIQQGIFFQSLALVIAN